MLPSAPAQSSSGDSPCYWLLGTISSQEGLSLPLSIPTFTLLLLWNDNPA